MNIAKILMISLTGLSLLSCTLPRQEQKNLEYITLISECYYLTKEGKAFFDNKELFTEQQQETVKKIYLKVYGVCALENLPSSGKIQTLTEDLRNAIKGVDKITYPIRAFYIHRYS